VQRIRTTWLARNLWRRGRPLVEPLFFSPV
jgi:hypothetical protein